MATARQVMYSIRPLVLAETDHLDDQYFTQTLLPAFQREHPEVCRNWDVIYDARGHLHEPHTNRVVGLGTLEVREYLGRAKQAALAGRSIEFESFPLDYPTYGPRGRYKTVLFIEKEGFAPLLARAAIEKRYDLAIKSTKGMANVAGRRTLEELSDWAGVRVLVLHDFDKDGFSIRATLHQDTQRYQFEQPPDIVDLGLRLADVKAEGLEPEPCAHHKESSVDNLLANGATEDEIGFLLANDGQRVELNAFTSDQFLAWLERKLTEAGVTKLIPDDEMLKDAYRRAIFIHTINEKLDEFHEEAHAAAETATVPDVLRAAIEARLKEDPTLAWDQVVAELAESPCCAK
jgi:hypothetical protein